MAALCSAASRRRSASLEPIRRAGIRKIGSRIMASTVIKPGFVQHHHKGQRQGHDVADHAGERAGEGRLRADDVIVQPADQGPGPGPGEEGDRHLLDVVEDLRAEVHDHAFADRGGQPAGHQSQPGFGHRHDGDQHGQPDDDVGAPRRAMIASTTCPARTGVATARKAITMDSSTKAISLPLVGPGES